MKGLNYYLAYGDTYPIKKSTVVDVFDHDWDMVKPLFVERLRESLQNINSNHLSFCGTTAGLTMRHLLGDKISKLWMFDGINIDPLLTGYKAQYAVFDPSNIEADLIKIQEMADAPRCSMEDLFAYHRQEYMSREIPDSVYCEGGTDFLFLGFNVVNYMMQSLFRRKEYSMFKAMKYSNGKAQLNDVGSHKPDIYTDMFNNGFFYFTHDEMKELWVEPAKNIIDPSTQATFMSSFFDLGYHMVYEMRTKVFGDHFGLDIYSPFYNDPGFVNFCLSIPMEMKYCVGRKKHILKESFDLSCYRKLPHFDLENKLFGYIRTEIGKLANKYLTNKKNKIFNYLPYDVVQKYLSPDNKKTIVLLNLAIWMEVHKC